MLEAVIKPLLAYVSLIIGFFWTALRALVTKQQLISLRAQDTENMAPSLLTMEDMYEEIDHDKVPCAVEVGQEEFVPAAKLQKILTKSNVKAVLSEQGVQPTSGLVAFILSQARKIFLTLVCVGNVSEIANLRAAGVDDETLPIGRDINKKISSLDKNTLQPTGATIPVMEGWRTRNIISFVDYQWYFQAPSFPEYKYHKLSAGCALPILRIRDSPKDKRPNDKRSNDTVASGGSGTVYQLELLDNLWPGPGEVQQPRASPRVVAVKKFHEDVTKYFGREQEVLGTIAKMKEHRHILKAIAAFERGTDHCVLFPWANGGNLNDFWRKSDSKLRDPALCLPLVQWCMEQMLGIAEGLYKLHLANCRHGDLKPENLLHFKESKGEGRLVVADFGLSKFHIEETHMRDLASTSWHSTLRYQPPEVVTHSQRPRSRHYDIWSVGCTFLEFVVWIVGGSDQLAGFRNSAAFDKFWESVDEKAVIHRRVESQISNLLNDPEDSATKEIVKLVQKCLVVKFSEGKTLPDERKDRGTRATSADVFETLETIVKLARKDKNYLIGRRTAVTGDNQVGQPSNQPETYRIEQIADLDDRWDAVPDNNFAKELFKRPDWVPPAPPSTPSTATCDKCSAIDFFSPRSEILFDQGQLLQQSENCSICAVIQEALLNLGWTEQCGTIVRVGSEFRVSSRKGKEFLILSMYVDPSTPSENVEEIAQLGYPDLPRMGSPQQYEIIRAWRDTCDTKHEGCYPWKTADDLPPMPTRVIYVGTKAEPDLRLVETAGKSLKAKYIALSHCWGQLADKDKFCTTSGTRKFNIKRIPFERLPKSFRDAVTVTREIGVHYLWIDSICIIQGDDGDWADEAQKMGSVFGSAYCTLAASSAKSSTEGFLGPEGSEPGVPRVSRKTATVRTPDGSHLYLCRSIDNFRDDVEGSVLASRGWVFQERALSRRTIHFTSTQLYWECGHGVHCETLTRLVNTKASLMGDAEFPKYVLDYFKGGQIVLFQYLYQLYSNRDFSHDSDRAVALRGLEDRLGEKFGTGADFGMIGKFPQRSLLWKRANPCQRLSHIEQPENTHVPSWSWMAYTGAIAYLEVPMKSTTWRYENVTMPPEWNTRPSERDGARVTQIRAVAFGLNVDMMWWKKGITMDRDDNASPDFGVLKCTVVGEERDSDDDTENEKSKTHAGERDLDGKIQYVLIVKPLPGGAKDLYERVGVGGLPATKIRKHEKMDIVLV